MTCYKSIQSEEYQSRIFYVIRGWWWVTRTQCHGEASSRSFIFLFVWFFGWICIRSRTKYLKNLMPQQNDLGFEQRLIFFKTSVFCGIHMSLLWLRFKQCFIKFSFRKFIERSFGWGLHNGIGCSSWYYERRNENKSFPGQCPAKHRELYLNITSLHSYVQHLVKGSIGSQLINMF